MLEISQYSTKISKEAKVESLQRIRCPVSTVDAKGRSKKSHERVGGG